MGRANRLEVAISEWKLHIARAGCFRPPKNSSGEQAREFQKLISDYRLPRALVMKNEFKLLALREKHVLTPARPKGLRFFSELKPEAQFFAVSEERERSDRFDWDDAEFLTEDFKAQLAEYGFEETEVYWSLGYCQGDGVAFYGRVYPESLKEKDGQAKQLIAALEAAGDELYIEITGKNGHYHHWNSMTVEIEFENGTHDEDLPVRLKIARPALRENFEEYLAERVKDLSHELEKSGYAEIEYRYDEDAVRDELQEREHLYEKDGARAMTEVRFYEWAKPKCAVAQAV